jgi:diguanylate cyclase (GGDEF)-like protein
MPRPSVLLVDDEPTNIHLLRAILEDSYDLFFATTGVDALRVAAAERPDLVLLDVVMPEMDGYEVCRRLQADRELGAVPVIFVTGMRRESDEATGLQLGALDYITKPFHPGIVQLRIRNQIALKRQRDRLARLSEMDGLTELCNRRTLDESLDREWRRGLRSRRPLSLIMIDIDYFKSYNDHCGHPGGDECLRAVAGALQSRLQRAGDTLGRFGGDEFLAILPDTEGAGAWALGDAMCAAVAALRIPHPDRAGGGVTVSVGVATARTYRRQNRTDLQNAVDEALYRAKHAGRNRVSY